MTPSQSVTLDLAGLSMTVHADAACRPGLLRLARAWGSCHRESHVAPPAAEIFATLDPTSGQVVVRAGPLLEQGEFELAECHLAMERALYAELARLLPEDNQMLHAGAVVSGGSGYLFVGPSGAGKSSLCLAALGSGALYLSDDILTTDGQEVRGVARAIQFDPPREDPPFPAWLENAPLDFRTYTERVDGERVDGEDNSVPLFVPGIRMTIRGAQATSFKTVLLERGEGTRLVPVARAEALGELIGASFLRQRSVDLGPLLSQGAWRLIWREPDEAWRALEGLNA